MNEALIRLDGIHTPRLDEYFGLWAFEDSRFMASFSRVSQMDLHLHVAETPKPKAESTTLFTPLAKADDGDGVPLGGAGGNGGGVGKIAVFMITGSMMKQVGSMEAGTSTLRLRSDIRKAMADDDVMGALFLLDSPGGTVAGTADLASDISAFAAKKPCIGQIEDICASACMWAAAAMPKVYAGNQTAMVGSIGTFLGLYDYSGAAGQAGIKAKRYATGDLKGARFPGAEITAKQDAYFQKMVDDTQVYFSAAVQKGRKFSDEQMKAVTTGGCFLAGEAMKLGLIDGIQSFDESLAQLQGMAGKYAAKFRGKQQKMKAAAERGVLEGGVTDFAAFDAAEAGDATGVKLETPPSRNTTLAAGGDDGEGGCACTCGACMGGDCDACSCGGCQACADSGCAGCEGEGANAAAKPETRNQKPEKEQEGLAAGALPAAGPLEIKKELAMSEPTNTGTPAGGTAAAGGGGASLKELKAALPKANAEFLVKAMEDGLTVSAAKDRYIEAVESERDQANLKNKPHGAAAVGTRTPPGTSNGAENGSAAAQLKAFADENRKAGLSREKAWAKACRDHADLREAYVEEFAAANTREEKKALTY